MGKADKNLPKEERPETPQEMAARLVAEDMARGRAPAAPEPVVFDEPAKTKKVKKSKEDKEAERRAAQEAALREAVAEREIRMVEDALLDLDYQMTDLESLMSQSDAAEKNKALEEVEAELKRVSELFAEKHSNFPAERAEEISGILSDWREDLDGFLDKLTAVDELIATVEAGPRSPQEAVMNEAKKVLQSTIETIFDYDRASKILTKTYLRTLGSTPEEITTTLSTGLASGEITKEKLQESALQKGKRALGVLLEEVDNARIKLELEQQEKVQAAAELVRLEQERLQLLAEAEEQAKAAKAKSSAPPVPPKPPKPPKAKQPKPAPAAASASPFAALAGVKDRLPTAAEKAEAEAKKKKEEERKQADVETLKVLKNFEDRVTVCLDLMYDRGDYSPQSLQQLAEQVKKVKKALRDFDEEFQADEEAGKYADPNALGLRLTEVQKLAAALPSTEKILAMEPSESDMERVKISAERDLLGFERMADLCAKLVSEGHVLTQDCLQLGDTVDLYARAFAAGYQDKMFSPEDRVIITEKYEALKKKVEDLNKPKEAPSIELVRRGEGPEKLLARVDRAVYDAIDQLAAESPDKAKIIETLTAAIAKLKLMQVDGAETLRMTAENFLEMAMELPEPGTLAAPELEPQAEPVPAVEAEPSPSLPQEGGGPQGAELGDEDETEEVPRPDVVPVHLLVPTPEEPEEKPDLRGIIVQREHKTMEPRWTPASVAKGALKHILAFRNKGDIWRLEIPEGEQFGEAAAQTAAILEAAATMGGVEITPDVIKNLSPKHTAREMQAMLDNLKKSN